MTGATSIPRWTAGRKAQLVRDHLAGVISAQEVEQRHDMSQDELVALVKRYGAQGEDGLKVRRIQEARV